MSRSFAANFLVFAALLCIPPSFAMRAMDFFEQYDLSELDYVGTDWRRCGPEKYNSATVLDPWGFPHPVRRGHYTGLNFGLVSQITPTYIELKELLQDAEDKWFERTVALPLMKQRARHARWRFEEDRALESLGESNEGKQLKNQLVWCRELFGKDKDAERLFCFDRAVGTLY